MAGSFKIHTFSVIVLTLVAASAVNLPASEPDSEGTVFFARCEACHPDNADTTKTSPHYHMKCLDCHQVSSFQQNTHNSTIPACTDCHAGMGTARQHEKFRYFSEPFFVYSPGITENDRATYISVVKPADSAVSP